MDHYFLEKQKSEHEILKITENIRGIEFSFLTDRGVFSRKKVDKGSKLLAKSIEAKKEDTLLDIGCGYGVVGIVLSKFVKNVYMIDINRRAVTLTKKNVVLNGCTNVSVLKKDFFKLEIRGFDIIATNPPFRMGKEYVFRIIEKVPEFLKDEGRFYMVVRTKQGSKNYEEKIAEIFGKSETVDRESGYRVLKGVKC
ncbi:MAG: class I SAM-dependent methyltransferase [Methanomicrobia archaeon]|nr:class I SAM-dependent methyltransferase [Methanomicrobia archaeon]